MAFSVNVFAGGIVTNTNQSAQYVRTLNRNASTELDAVYYNPAGLSALEDGFHLYFSNQSVFQVKGIDAKYDVSMNTTNFEGNTGVWFYPNIYMAIKRDKVALSAGFMPIGGGGSAEYKDGLPSFEKTVASMVPLLSSVGATDYKYEVSFEGSSVYYGMQAGLTYEVNKQLSVYGGLRFIIAENTYEGYLKNIQVDLLDGDFVNVSSYFSGLQQTFDAGATSMEALVNSGAGDYTLSQLVSAGYITQSGANTIISGLVANGVTQDEANAMSVSSIQTTYSTIAAQMGEYSNASSDIDVDATKSGWGYSVILGVNVSPNDDLNIGLRYESKANMELKTDSNISSGTGLESFYDGEKFGADMPAMIALGVSYQMSDKLRLEGSFDYFFDKDVDWDGREKNLDNALEFGLCAEYQFTDDLCASVGYLRSNTAASEKYRTDLDYGLDSNSLAFGVGYKLADKVKLDFGLLDSFYIDGKNADGSEEYYKTTLVTSMGISYKF